MLVGSCLTIVLAFLLQVRPDQRVAFVGLVDYPLPQTCAMRAWFGWNCPGCGMTRSLIHLAHGDWRAAYKVHRLGFPMAAAILFQVPYRILSLRRPDRRLLGFWIPWIFSAGMIALLFANWLWNVATTPV